VRRIRVPRSAYSQAIDAPRAAGIKAALDKRGFASPVVIAPAVGAATRLNR
jgi:hypothetical protein